MKLSLLLASLVASSPGIKICEKISAISLKIAKSVNSAVARPHAFATATEAFNS